MTVTRTAGECVLAPSGAGPRFISISRYILSRERARTTTHRSTLVPRRGSVRSALRGPLRVHGLLGLVLRLDRPTVRDRVVLGRALLEQLLRDRPARLGQA